MSEPDPTQFLSDPLSEISRKERRNVLVASTVGLLVSTMGLVPTKLAAFDIELSAPAQNSFVGIVALVIAYFTIAFMVYGVSDLFIWRKRYQDYLVAAHFRNESWTIEDQMEYDRLHEHVPRIHWLYSWSRPLSLVRIAFEFALPIIAGAIAVCLLLAKI